MVPNILAQAAEVAVQTVFLTIGLWIMIKILKLDYTFLGLLGSAAFVSALNKILGAVIGHFAGTELASYISTPIVVAVLLLCIAKVTHGEPVDVLFTVAVGYALWFCMNLWLIGTLMGDLSPSTRFAKEEVVEAEREAEYQAAMTNQPVPQTQATNKAMGKTAPAGKSPGKNDSTNSAKLTPAELAKETIKSFSLKGIISAGEPSAMIYSGVKTYTVFRGDSVSMETANGNVTVRCEKLDKDRVVLSIAGEQVTLFLPGAAR